MLVYRLLLSQREAVIVRSEDFSFRKGRVVHSPTRARTPSKRFRILFLFAEAALAVNGFTQFKFYASYIFLARCTHALVFGPGGELIRLAIFPRDRCIG